MTLLLALLLGMTAYQVCRRDRSARRSLLLSVAIIATLTPLVERAKKEKELADAKAAYEAKSKPIIECYNKLGKGGQMPDLSSVQSPAYEALTKRLTVLTQRAVG